MIVHIKVGVFQPHLLYLIRLEKIKALEDKMKIIIRVNGKTLNSYDKPTMGHKRKAAAIANMELEVREDPKVYFTLLNEMYNFVISAFPKMSVEDLDKMETDDFNDLFEKVSTWILTDGQQINDEEKKNGQRLTPEQAKIQAKRNYEQMLMIYQNLLLKFGILPSQLDKEDAGLFFEVLSVEAREVGELKYIDEIG